MSQRDLFVVVADLDAENAMSTLLCDRQPALGIDLSFIPKAPPEGDLLRYVGRDSGCYKDAVDVLRTPRTTHRHALLVFDRDGSGAEDKSREEIEIEVETRLQRNGWNEESVSVIVIDPELEAWVWSESPKVAEILGWRNESDELRSFLAGRKLWPKQSGKPCNPKEAMRQSLRRRRKPLGARLFSELALQVRLGDCHDRAFLKLREKLRKWFPR